MGKRSFLIFLILLSETLLANGNVGVRAQSLGGAVRALGNYEDAIFYNPASILSQRIIGTSLSYKHEAPLNTNQFVTSIIDTKTTAWGLGLGYILNKSFREEKSSNHEINLSVAMPLYRQFLFLGSSFHYLYDKDLSVKNYRHYFNIDIGLLARTSYGLNFAMVIDNILNPKGKEKPLALSFAASFFPPTTVLKDKLSLSIDWSMHDWKNVNKLTHKVSLGARFTAASIIPIRLGFENNFKNKRKNVSIGSGLEIEQFETSVVYMQNLKIGPVREFGISMSMNI